MTRTAREVENDIVNTLKITAPGLSNGIGTPERKIISAVAEAISESYLDNYVATQQWDIDTLAGQELEQFVNLFGFGRLLGRHAVGTITFTTTFAATENIIIPAGTQAYAGATPTRGEIYFATTTAGIIPKGQFTTEVPAQATVAGLAGNVGSGGITGFVAQFGITGIANNSPFSGGLDAESDTALRERFRRTVLRNVAGTADFYRNICLMHQNVSKVNVIGPISRWQEQLQVQSGAATSTITADISKYSWPRSSIVSQNLGQEAEKFYTESLHYTSSETVVPTYTILNGSVPNGEIIDVEHEYTSAVGRNDPANGVMNKVDIFINGQDPIEAIEAVVVGTAQLSATEGLYAAKNWKRTTMNGAVSANSFITILGHAPIITFPDTINAGGMAYTEGVDYTIIQYQDQYKGSSRGRQAIEWITGKPTGTITLQYEYNRLPILLNAILAEKKQVTTDPLVRMAENVEFRVNAVIMYTAGFESTYVNSAIKDELAKFFAALDFGSWIQMADIERVIHNVQGVDNVRLFNTYDGGASVSRMVNGVATWGTFHDFKLKDNELAVFHSLNLVRKSFNTYNPGGAIHW